MVQEEPFLIPIDDAIEAFRHHLDSHDRTILSACFGDGKSFLLSHFMKDVDVAERYTFLTIFPVNYQVTENCDIFELIKRDILLQMLLKGVIETDIEISDAEALALYLQSQPLSFIESFLPLLSELALPDDSAKAVALAQLTKNFFKSVKQKIDKIKLQSRDTQIENFLNEVEQNPIVGQDAISNIIKRGIEQYRDSHPGKKVVLVIEDLDRIDPAHLFRILNIFSAHIDFCYRLGLEPDESIRGNKFGLDKVVFVMDYKNVENLYHHFYGNSVSYAGYIEKFCSSNYFPFSLQEQKSEYFLKRISQETDLDAAVLNLIIKPGDFNDKSIRNVVQAIERSSDFVIDIATAKNQRGEAIPLHPGILRLIAILRRLGIEDSEIQIRFNNAMLSKSATTATSLFLYLAPYLSLIKFKNALGDIRFAKSTDITNTVHVDDITDGGLAFCSYSHSLNYENNAEISVMKLLSKLLKMVSR